MAKMSIAQIEYLSQQLSEELDTVRHLTSKAWVDWALLGIR